MPQSRISIPAAADGRDPDARPEELVRRVYDDVNRFAEGMPQFDDMTMLCVKYLGNKEPEH